MRLPTALS